MDYIESNSFEVLLFNLEELLKESPHGISEYELMKALGEYDGFNPFSRISGSSLDLFLKHYLLFHGLYRLRDRLLENYQFDIIISVMEVKLIPFVGSDNMVAKLDSLRDYYLDLSNIINSSKESVNDLLDSFWEMYLQNDLRKNTLATLGLVDPIDDDAIVLEFRKQAMTHHPDRGGELKRFQAINEAYSLLIG